LLPGLDLGVARISRGLGVGGEMLWRVDDQDESVAGTEDFEVGDAGAAEGVDDGGPDSVAAMLGLILGDECRMVVEVESVDESLHGQRSVPRVAK
jgi:hypothetical protein